MIYQLLANGVLVVHFAFVAFVVFGAFLVLRWPKIMWLHLVAATWGVLIELFGLVCPLTPLEVTLRQLSGEAGYEGGFIEHYFLAALYPAGLTRELQVWLGFLALVPNVLVYGYYFMRKRRAAASHDGN